MSAKVRVTKAFADGADDFEHLLVSIVKELLTNASLIILYGEGHCVLWRRIEDIL